MNAFVCSVFVENMYSNSIILFFVVVRGIARDAEGRCFNSRAGQIGPSVTIAAVFLRSWVAQALSRGDGPRISLHFSA